MKIDKDSLKKLSHLARLKYNPDKAEETIRGLEDIIDWVEKLNEVNTDNVEPLTHMSEVINNFREDVAKDHISREDGLFNAPKKDDEYFRVPKVLD